MTKQIFALFTFLFALPLCVHAKDLYHIKHLTEHELLDLYQVTLHDACHHSDKFWTNSSFDPQAGFWGSGRSDNMNEGVRAIGEMVLTSAVLLKYSDVLTPAEREDYLHKSIAALRYVTATHATGTQKCPNGKPWGDSWQSAMWTATFGFGSWLLWDKLDPALQKDLERVIGHEADRFLSVKPPGGSFNDTKAEENGWNLICLSLAANMFTNNPHAAACYEKAQEYAMNTFSAPQDRTDKTLVDGKPVSEWFAGENVHADFTLENHGFFHPSYIGCSSYFLTQTAMHFTYAHRPVPQAATHHLLDVWQMFRPFLLPTGEAAYPQGMDWELHGLPFINLYASLASYQKDGFAARLERSALQYLRAWQLMDNGSLTFPGSRLDFTRHAINCEQIAYGFLAHQLFGPPASLPHDHEFDKQVEGVRHYDDIQLITHRGLSEFVSMSWTNRVMGLLIPLGPNHEGNPDFTVSIANGLIGSFDLTTAAQKGDNKVIVLNHSWTNTLEGFETTGTLLLNGGALKQTMKLASFLGHTAIYQDHVVALRDVGIAYERGIPVGIENDDFTGCKRTLYFSGGATAINAQGVAALTQQNHPPITVPGNWASVDGRLGVVLVSPGSLTYQQARGYSPGISVCADVLSAGSTANPRFFRAGDVVARRIAIFYFETTPAKTAELARFANIRRGQKDNVLGQLPDVVMFKLPDGREGAVALHKP